MTATEAIRKLREVIRRQHKALATEASYVHWLRRYMAALAGMPRTLTREQKLERFLTELALSRDVAASTQNRGFNANAIAFFYKDVLGTPLQNVDALRATRPAHWRHAPTVTETRALLQAGRDVAGSRIELTPDKMAFVHSRQDQAAVGSSRTGIGSTRQMCWQYSRMARSEEK